MSIGAYPLGYMQGDERSLDHRHQAVRIPAPTARPGTLLFLVQLAHRLHANPHGSGGDKRASLLLAKRYGSLLVQCDASAEQCAFVVGCDHPWNAVRFWIEIALSQVIGRGSAGDRGATGRQGAP